MTSNGSRTREANLSLSIELVEFKTAMAKQRLILLALLSLVAGCSTSIWPTATQSVTPLTIAAASDLQTVLPRIVERFEPTSRRSRIVLTFGASGQLAEQIKAGAPY